MIFALFKINCICGASATIFQKMWLFCVALHLGIVLDFMPVKSYVQLAKKMQLLCSYTKCKCKWAHTGLVLTPPILYAYAL